MDPDLLPDAGQFSGGIPHDPVRGDGGVPMVPVRSERHGRVGFDAGDAAADDEELVADGKAFGKVRVLREEVFRVADLEHRGDKVYLALRGRRLDPLEVGVIDVVHQREAAEVRVFEQERREADLRGAVHQLDQLVDVLPLGQVERVIDPLFAQGEILEGRGRRRGRARGEEAGRNPPSE